MPGIDFAGYDAPFHWNDLTPRVGMTYALDEARKTILRASFSRNAGQLTAVGTYIGYANPSSAAGWVEYPWIDANGDHLAQTNEVQVNQPLLASGGGFNTANPTAVASANRIDPDFKAPSSTGVHRRLRSRADAQPGAAGELHLRPGHQPPDVPVHRHDHRRLGAVRPLAGTTAGRRRVQHAAVPARTARSSAANGGGRLLTNFDGYYTKFNGIELSMNKRMSNRWQMRLADRLQQPDRGL